MAKAARTIRATYHATVKEGEPPIGEPWISISPQDGELNEVLGGGFVGLELRPGTTRKDADDLAEALRNHVTHISFTMLQG